MWSIGQRDGHAQLTHGEYTGDTALDQDRIPPALAAYAITHCTHPATLVLDPDCGAGTVLVEALRAGQHAIDLTTNHRYRELARANPITAHRTNASPEGKVLDDAPTTKAGPPITSPGSPARSISCQHMTVVSRDGNIAQLASKPPPADHYSDDSGRRR